MDSVFFSILMHIAYSGAYSFSISGDIRSLHGQCSVLYLESP